VSESFNLTNKQKRFCEEYIIDLNATAAYIRAGYAVKNENSAAASASALLRNPKIQRYIQELMQSRSQTTGITAERVLQEIGRIAFADMRRFSTWGPGRADLKRCEELSEDETAAIAEVSHSEGPKGSQTKIKLHDKVAALTLAAKHTGLLGELNQAIAIFRKYGYEVRQTDRGFEMTDTYSSEIVEAEDS
jgi:phage terminase small subunit